MLRTGRRRKMLILGLSFLGLGLFFFYKGVIHLIIAGRDFFAGKEMGFSFLGFLNSFIGSPEQSTLLLVCLALSLGFLMGHIMLKKAFKKFYIILWPLIFISFALRFLPLDIRGFIDFLIGSLLISRAFFAVQSMMKKKDSYTG